MSSEMTKDERQLVDKVTNLWCVIVDPNQITRKEVGAHQEK
jgi:hypothetical protein